MHTILPTSMMSQVAAGDFRSRRDSVGTRGRRWVLWLIGLLTVLGGLQRALAIPICGDGICQGTGVPPETAQSCWQDCGAGDPCVHKTCTSCDRPASGVDMDEDGVPDRLEYDLAHRFFPNIWLQTLDNDLGESYLYRNRSLPYLVRPLPPVPQSPCEAAFECLEIRYGIAYFRDHGVDIWIFEGEGSHQGDSEFYAALVRRTVPYTIATTSPSSWQLIRDYTMAHHGELTDASKIGVYGFCPSTPCSTWDSDSEACQAHGTRCQEESARCTGRFRFCSHENSQSTCEAHSVCSWESRCVAQERWSCYASQPRTTRATLYASKNKHALYHTVGECDMGGLWFDSCDNNDYNMRTYKGLHLLQNIGSDLFRDVFDRTIQHPSYCGTYDVWTAGSFGEAGGYKRKFRDFIPWMLH